MLDRRIVGKQLLSFNATLEERFVRDLHDLAGAAGLLPWTGTLPFSWPAMLTARGTACLMGLWEELGVDPLSIRLVAQSFRHSRDPAYGETLAAALTIEDVSEHVESDRGIEEQVDLVIRFRDSNAGIVAEYRCSYRILRAAVPDPSAG